MGAVDDTMKYKLTPLACIPGLDSENVMKYQLSRNAKPKMISIEEFEKYKCQPIRVGDQITPAWSFGLNPWFLVEAIEDYENTTANRLND